MEWFIESDLSNERHKSVVWRDRANANKYIDLFCQPRSAPVLRWEAVTRAGSRRQVARRRIIFEAPMASTRRAGETSRTGSRCPLRKRKRTR